MTWTKSYPSGAWQVTDDRLHALSPTAMRTMTYYGYNLKDARAAHAEHIRNLKAGKR